MGFDGGNAVLEVRMSEHIIIMGDDEQGQISFAVSLAVGESFDFSQKALLARSFIFNLTLCMVIPLLS